jgi:hypothetical protein
MIGFTRRHVFVDAKAVPKADGPGVPSGLYGHINSSETVEMGGTIEGGSVSNFLEFVWVDAIYIDEKLMLPKETMVLNCHIMSVFTI